MELIIAFPFQVLSAYHGADNLDFTLDDHISYLIGKYFYDHHIDFKILSLNQVNPQPNINDKLIRYRVFIDIDQVAFQPDLIRTPLLGKGFEKGLTIKSLNNDVLFADQFTADIQYRRDLRNKI